MRISWVPSAGPQEVMVKETRGNACLLDRLVSWRMLHRSPTHEVCLMLALGRAWQEGHQYAGFARRLPAGGVSLFDSRKGRPP